MYLEKKDVSLYYEVKGTGEPLLLIHGIVVDSGFYDRTSALLAEQFKVITYDRRGNSRSKLKGEKFFSMDTQIEDILDLLNELGIRQTYIVGCSAGAVIGERFLERYPNRVRHLVMYEPAMFKLMENEPGLREWITEIHHLVETHKFSNAILRFTEQMPFPDPRSPKKEAEVSFREMGNHEYALSCEFPGLVAYEPDLKKIKEQAGKVTLAAGEKSGDTIYARAAARMAIKTGKKEIYYPGSHNLPYDLPLEFAICILGTLVLKK